MGLRGRRRTRDADAGGGGGEGAVPEQGVDAREGDVSGSGIGGWKKGRKTGRVWGDECDGGLHEDRVIFYTKRSVAGSMRVSICTCTFVVLKKIG